VLGHEIQFERVAGCRDAVGALVVCTIDGAFLGAGFVVGADGRVPGIVSVAVCGARGAFVGPAPVGVEDDFSGDGFAAAFRALLPG
jgi:hypothetical protein